MKLPRTATLLVFACAGAAAVLGASEFMTTFHLTPPGGEALDVPQRVTEAANRHNYAMLVLAVFALVALVATLYSGSQVATFAVAAAGVIALLIFLIGDLPDANRIGTLDDVRDSFIDAKAEPQPGFWLELIGSLLLALCGAALATLPPEDLTIGARRGEGEGATGEGTKRGAKRAGGQRQETAGKAGSDGRDDPGDSFEWTEPGSKAGGGSSGSSG